MKLKCIVSCPIDCYSGYSHRSRDFVKSLIRQKGEEWDIKILPQRWGSTPWGYLKDNNETDLINRCLPLNQQLPYQPDVWFMITVPNEFQPVGRYLNVGVTAGIETNVCDASWLEGCNRMDFTIVSSEHSNKVLSKTTYDIKNPQNPNDVRKLANNQPVEVLFEGVDVNAFTDKSNLLDLKQVRENFNYLFVGHWLPGNVGEDRKNVGLLVKTFYETFKDKANTPGLILKTAEVDGSILDRDKIWEKINVIRNSVKYDKSLPNVYLIHGDLSTSELSGLYNHPKVKAHISFTKGEGFGRPLLEASLSGKPIITSNWSGHLDFLHKDFNVLLGGQIKPISRNNLMKNALIEGAQWFNVDPKVGSGAMQAVRDNYSQYSQSAKKQAKYSKANFSLEKMDIKLKEILDKYTPSKIPTTLNLSNLPKLKKVGSITEKPKINLPKLQKVTND